MSNNWFIESISLTQTATPPTKEEMEKFLPSSWPTRWEEVDRYVKDGQATISLAHLNPYPNEEAGLAILKQSFGIAVAMPSLKPKKFNFVGHISIIGYSDKQTAKQFFESYQTIPTQGLSALTPGTPMNIPLDDLIKAFAPKEMVKEFESALEKGKKELAKSGVKIEKGKYLGEEAILTVGKDGKRGYNAVLINNFIITGMLSISDALPPGSTPIHARPIDCPCKGNRPCSTRKAAGYIYREEVEQILKSIFSKIKGEKEEAKGADAEIIRGQNKIKNPKEKFEVRKGDIIKTDKRTQANIADSAGNKMWIGGGSGVKINEPSNFELIIGSITAFIKSLQPKSKFEIHTPTVTTGVRGTIFSVWTDKTTTSLTVIEGEVEFSDLKGNKVIVKSNQTCVCSKGQGLQQPITLSMNLKEQFKGV